MSGTAPGHEEQTIVCPNCAKPANEALLVQREYLCPACGFEVAYTGVGPNGSLCGILGYIKVPGEIVHERYQIDRVLGKGGFGTTYLASDLKIPGKRRALKEVPLPLFESQEADLLGRLRHPSIPDIVDRFQEKGMAYLVLEFGGKRTLASQCLQAGGKIPLGIALRWMRQLCEVLEYLHAQTPPVIHRDLKPANVLLDDQDRVMLVDFGISKASHSAEATRILARAVSHGFSSPEQVLGTGTDVRSDIYSFGATFYYVLTGITPTPAHQRLAGVELPLPSSVAPTLPREANVILLDCLNLNADQRPSNVSEVGAMLSVLEQASLFGSTLSSRTTILDPEQMAPVRLQMKGALHGIRIPADGLASAEGRDAATKWEKVIRSGGLILLLAVVFGVMVLAARVYQAWQGPEKPKTLSNVTQGRLFPDAPDSSSALTESPASENLGGSAGPPRSPVDDHPRRNRNPRSSVMKRDTSKQP